MIQRLMETDWCLYLYIINSRTQFMIPPCDYHRPYGSYLISVGTVERNTSITDLITRPDTSTDSLIVSCPRGKLLF